MSGVYKTEEWLKKYGWSKGKGLGKNENGIKDFIKVDKKDDTAGLGGEGYAIRDFNWWDNIYNKAAQKLKIESTEDGKSVVHVEQHKVEVTPEKKYGVFVKSKEPDNFSSNIREEELIKVCEGRQLKASMTGKLARLEEQEKQVISSNTLRISKQRRQEDSSDDSNSIKKQPKENKKPYGSNYRPLVLNEKVVQTGDKVKKTEDNKVADNSNENNKESKKSKKNKKRKRSEMELKDDLSSNSKNDAQNTKTTNNKQKDDKKQTIETKSAPSNGFFFFNYDNENKKLDDSKNTTPQPASIVELYSDGTERKSKSARRKAKKQRTK